MGFIDEGTDIYYIYTQNFKDVSIKNSMIFFLIGSIMIQTIAASYILTTTFKVKKLNLQEVIEIKDAVSIKSFLFSYIKHYTIHTAKLICGILYYMPLALGITVL